MPFAFVTMSRRTATVSAPPSASQIALFSPPLTRHCCHLAHSLTVSHPSIVLSDMRSVMYPTPLILPSCCPKYPRSPSLITPRLHSHRPNLQKFNDPSQMTSLLTAPETLTLHDRSEDSDHEGFETSVEGLFSRYIAGAPVLLSSQPGSNAR